MSKMKRTPEDIANARLRQAIKGSAAFYDHSAENQADIAGVSRATWYRRLQYPGDITIREFRRLLKKYRWDEQTVLDILRV